MARFKVVGIVGARQVGKTTLAHMFSGNYKGETTVFDLENPEDLARLADPMLALKSLKGLIVIDEVQRLPGIFQVLRVLVDRFHSKARFLVLGSASPSLLQQGSDTLAGRIIYHTLSGFSLDEIGAKNHTKLWLRGGFPRSYLARSLTDSFEWRRAFIKTFLERDILQLGINIKSATLHRFWTMLAHYHGQVWNSSEFGRAFGVADTTVRNYLDILTSALVVRQLPAWHENIAKRQVKAPKVYIADSGLVHALLNLKSLTDLERHPKVGASWEGFVISELVQHLSANTDECFFWATHQGAELDLLVVRGRHRLGFEIKRTSSPQVTSSMRSALASLKLKNIDVLYAGEKTYPLTENIRAVPLSRLLKDIKPLS